MNIFTQLEELVPTLPGWGEVEKATTLAAMVIAMRPAITVEIGVYGGRSFFGLALAHKLIGHGTAIGIDPWSNEAAVEGYEGENREFWRVNPLGQIHDDFQVKVLELGVQNVVRIERVKSDDAEVPRNIGLCHCDGQHSEQAVRDVKRFAPRIHLGGFMVMDDTGWTNGADAPVQRAVFELKKIGFESRYKLGTGEVFQRTRW